MTTKAQLQQENEKLRAALVELLDSCTELVPDRLGPGLDMVYTRRPQWEPIEKAREALGEPK